MKYVITPSVKKMWRSIFTILITIIVAAIISKSLSYVFIKIISKISTMSVGV